MRKLQSVTLLAAVLVMVQSAKGEVVNIGASKDNTLYENLTGSLSNGAGDHMFTGTIGTGEFRRGVIAFDVAGSVPAGLTINSVSLTLYMSRTIAGFEIVSLHALQADWGEGTSDAPGEEGAGTSSTPGDATWIHTFHDTDFWASAGGDYNPISSADKDVGTEGFYTWDSTAQLVADVQSWVDAPAGSFGWILIGNEGATVTAKRFDTRENPVSGQRPVLTIDFAPPTCCRGDTDDNGLVNGDDIEAFVDCILGGGEPVRACACSDFDGNCIVDINDIPMFVSSLVTGVLDCTETVGACCLPNGTCIRTTACHCAILNPVGNNFNPGADCATVMCPQPTGACCRIDGTCEITTQDDCGGPCDNYLGNGTVCTGFCPLLVPTPCCFPDGSCMVMQTCLCTAQGGDPQPPLQTCATVNCPEEPGACCLPDGTCFEGTVAECDNQCGVYQGANTTCLDTLCTPLPTGACCFEGIIPGFFCVEETECECLRRPISVYFGDGTVCVPDFCQVGACCLPDGSCVEVLEPDCVGQCGVFQGEATTCAGLGGGSRGSGCTPQPLGACCFDNPPDGVYCRLLTQCECEQFPNGTYQGDGTDCATTFCPQPTGACCFGSYCLDDTTEADCDFSCGIWLGAGTICAGDVCPLVPVGACCSGAQCLDGLSQAECECSGFMTYHGDGSVCGTPPTGVDCLIGACCLPDGTCVETTLDDCQNTLCGTFRDYGTLCKDAHKTVFTMQMDVAQATGTHSPVPPAPPPTGSGNGAFILDPLVNELFYSVSFGGLSSPQIDAHIHGPGAPGVNAPVVYTLPLGTSIKGTLTLADPGSYPVANQVNDLLNGLWYMNIHTVGHPMGEIRGQMLVQIAACAPAPTGACCMPNPGPTIDVSDQGPGPIPQGSLRVSLTEVTSGLSSPVDLAHAGDGSGRLFVADQTGQIRIIASDGTLLPTPFLDLASVITPLDSGFDERGLLGIAFHPNYALNGRFFVRYSLPRTGNPSEPCFGTSRGCHEEILAEFGILSADVADPNSERILFRIDEPEFNHDGGALAFGSDGFLYFGLGDGGGANDGLHDPGLPHGPIGNGQNIDTALGALLRIDVDSPPDPGLEYAIPPTNPFAGNTVPGVDEIYAYGFRNPYKFSFDNGPGGSNSLYLADVGQDRFEEVDLVQLGGNYGWATREGLHCFDPFDPGNPPPLCPGTGPHGEPLLNPVAEYDHNNGDGISIIGGFVYRGSVIPELVGKYVFGDFSLSFAAPSGQLYYLDADGDPAQIFEFLLGASNIPLDVFVKGFGEDEAGEIYLLTSSNLGPFGVGGQVFRVDPAPATICTLSTECECLQVGGTFFGIGSTCTFDLCSRGACCMPDGTCVQSLPEECASPCQDFRGALTKCATEVCTPQPSGACCLADDSCVEVTQCECEQELSGTFFGAGTDCSPNPCVPPPILAELAGNPLAGYPYFEFVRAFNFDSAVYLAIDPTRYPVISGSTCDVYVVAAKTEAQWDADTSLIDVRVSGAQTVTFNGATIQGNEVLIINAAEFTGDAGTDVGVGYDVVIDCDQDGQLSTPDFIDGRGDEAGLYIIHDLTQLGPLPTAFVDYTVTGITAPGHGAERTWYPSGIASMGQLPLVVLSHGNGQQHTWYDYLQEHLVSYGYVVMSHRTNSVPGAVQAGITTMEHTDEFIGQQATIAGGIFDGHIDSTRITWIGHGRGGEGIVIAYTFMADGIGQQPVNYTAADIALLSAIAGTDTGGSIWDPHGANYHLLYGAADGIINGCAAYDDLQPFNMYDRGTGSHQATYVQGASHNDFNCCGFNDADGPNLLGRAAAQEIAKGTYLPLIKHHVDGNIPSKDFLWRQYESLRPVGSAATADVNRMYRDGASAGNFVIDDYQSQSSPNISSSGGAVSFDVNNLTEQELHDENVEFTWDPADPMNGMTMAGDQNLGVPDDSAGVVFDWSGGSHFYELEVIPGQRDISGDNYLSFRTCQGTQHPETIAELGDLTFTVTLRDGSGVTSSINIGEYGGGVEEPYQRVGTGFSNCGPNPGWANEFEVVRIRVSDFIHNGSGLDLTDVAAVRFEFGSGFGSAGGRIGLDEIEITGG